MMRGLWLFSLLVLIAATAVGQTDTSRIAVPDSLALQLAGQGLRPYTFGSEIAPFAAAPLVVMGVAGKGDEKSDAKNFSYDHYASVDSYLRFAPLAATVILKAAGVEGRSDWARLGVSTAGAYGITAALVYGLKWTVKETRPDGSARNSFPSGHTATAFAAATILHKEYGATVSPWISLGGYAVAGATAFMRTDNNYHWSGDVLMGAGIGIIATELAYGITDLIFKQRHIKRWEAADCVDYAASPSWVSIDMGAALPLGSVDFSPLGYTMKFGTGAAVGAEGTYLFNRHIGVGGRFRASHLPVKGLEEHLSSLVPTAANINLNHYGLAEYTVGAGAYLSAPVSSRVCLSAKLLAGYSAKRGIKATATSGPDSWVCWQLKAAGAFTFGTGIAAAYSASSRMAWRVFADFDFERNRYDLLQNADSFSPVTASSRSWLSKITLGTSLCTYF